MARPRATTVLLLITIVALLVPSILLKVEREREERHWQLLNRRCISHLSHIGIAFLLYAEEHGDSFPPDLATLVTTGYLNPDDLRCPVAAEGHGADAYVYHRPDSPLSRTPADTLVVEDPPAHTDEGANALFADGHSEFLTSAQLRAARHPPTTASTQP